MRQEIVTYLHIRSFPTEHYTSLRNTNVATEDVSTCIDACLQTEHKQ